MTHRKLSICIATLNRAKYLRETLDCLLWQVATLTDPQAVEIVVLDGGSKDGTRELMAGYCGPAVHYHRQGAPGGIDKDFDLAVEHACGEYVWLMSDDDLLNPGALASVLEALLRDYSLVIVNAEVKSSDLSVQLESRRLRLDHDTIYGPAEMDRLFRECGDYLNFIGCVVIRRSIWISRDRKPYYGSDFIHVGVIFQAPLPGDTLAIATTGVVIRYGQANWTARTFEIWMFKWPRLIHSLPGLSQALKQQAFPRDAWLDLKRLFFYRARGAYSLDEYRRLIAPLPHSQGKLGARLIAYVPGVLANAASLLYLRFHRRDYLQLLTDARNSRYHFRNVLKARGRQ